MVYLQNIFLPCKMMASCWAEDFLNPTSKEDDDSMDNKLRISVLSTLVCVVGAWACTAEVSWSTMKRSAALSARIPWNELFLLSLLAWFVSCQTTDSKALLRTLESFTNIRRNAPLNRSKDGNVIMSPSAVTCPPVTPREATSSTMHWSRAGSTRIEPCSWGREAIKPSKSFFQSSPLILRRPRSRVVMSSTATSQTYNRHFLIQNMHKLKKVCT